MNDFAERHPVAHGLSIFFGFILIVFATSAFIMGLKTNFSYWWGQQGATQEKNSARNFITAQRGFLQEKNDVDGFGQTIKLDLSRISDFDAAHPNLANEDALSAMQDRQDRASLVSDLNGVQQQCINTVTQYNTDAQAFLTADWRSANLPEQLSLNACNGR